MKKALLLLICGLAIIIPSRPVFSETAEIPADPFELIVPVYLMPFVEGFGINGINPAVYLPSGPAFGCNFWLYGEQLTDSGFFNYASGFDLAAKAGWSLVKTVDFSDKPKLSGIFGSGLFNQPLAVLGHRTTAFTFFAGFELFSRTEKLDGYSYDLGSSTLVEGQETSFRPFLELEFRNTYVMNPAWLHALNLLFWNWSDVTASARLYLNLPSRSHAIRDMTAYTLYTTDPAYSYKADEINNFEAIYSDNAAAVDMSVNVKYLFFILSWQQMLSSRPVFNMSMEFTFNFSGADKRDEIIGE